MDGMGRQVITFLRSRRFLTFELLTLLALTVALWSLPDSRVAAIAVLQRYLLLLGALGGGATILLLLWRLPTWQASRIPDPKDRLTLENATRQTLVHMVGGVVLLAGLFVMWAALNVVQENITITRETATKHLELAREEQITERLTKALAQLGDEPLTVRLGGIYTLERIAKDLDTGHWPIMEVLTAYVRARAPRVPEDAPSSKGHQPPHTVLPATSTPPLPTLATDIQAILTVLGRRRHTYGKGEYQRLNLASTDLQGAHLRSAQLQGADLRSTQLQRADLSDAQLQMADLRGANLQGASLSGAQLGWADLSGAQLQGAHLQRAQLQKADLRYANLQGAHLRGAQLQRADLWHANLQGADLWHAQLGGANLSGINLEGAHNVTVEQLATAKTLYDRFVDPRLDPPLLEHIRQQHPQLLERPYK